MGTYTTYGTAVGKTNGLLDETKQGNVPTVDAADLAKTPTASGTQS